jgi:sugar/nucleoside kinase (ribokinase family)
MPSDALSFDYLVIGHAAEDVTPEGRRLGGTVAYATRTALALGTAVAVVTSCREDLDLSPLESATVRRIQAPQSTTFRNRYTAEGRVQFMTARAQELGASSIPSAWHATPVVHFAPIADELDPHLAKSFPESTRCVTPQGWLRAWDEKGRVRLTHWSALEASLPLFHAAVLSIEDLQGEEHALPQLASALPVLAVTRGAGGATVFAEGERREFPAPQRLEVDPTGAGDIFAAAFFLRWRAAADVWQAARFANSLASASVARQGVEATPTSEEVQRASLEGW